MCFYNPQKLILPCIENLSGNLCQRSKRKYSFDELTAPTKLEVLELVEREKEITSARLADLMKIKLSHAPRPLWGYWSEGPLHREFGTRRYGGIRYTFSLTKTGRVKIEYFKKIKIQKNLF